MQSEADPNHYIRKDILLLLYVDNNLLAYAAAAAKTLKQLSALIYTPLISRL
jgi:hypothetical protein